MTPNIDCYVVGSVPIKVSSDPFSFAGLRLQQKVTVGLGIRG